MRPTEATSILVLRVRRAFPIVLAACLLGCAPSGEDPLSRLSVYEPPGREYRLRYLEPPWELVRGDGTTAHLRIASSTMIFGGIDGGAGKYDLLATVEGGSVEASVTAELAAASRRGEEVVEPPRDVGAQGGAVGREIVTRGTIDELDRNRRYAFFAVPGGRVLRLFFDATPAVDTPEVDAMIAALGVGSEGP